MYYFTKIYNKFSFEIYWLKKKKKKKKKVFFTLTKIRVNSMFFFLVSDVFFLYFKFQFRFFFENWTFDKFYFLNISATRLTKQFLWWSILLIKTITTPYFFYTFFLFIIILKISIQFFQFEIKKKKRILFFFPNQFHLSIQLNIIKQLPQSYRQ